MITYKLKQIMSTNKVSILLLLVALLIIPFSCSRPSTSFLDLHLEDEVFQVNLNGKFVKIRDERRTFSGSIKIKKIKENYIAHIDRVQPGTRRWYIELDGYQPVDLSIDISPGKPTVKKVQLTPGFGSVYIWGENGIEPRKAMKVIMEVKIGAFEDSALADEGVNIHQLTPGAYTLEAQAPGFLPITRSLKVEAGKKLEVRLPFQGIPGNLKVFAADAKNPGKLLEKELLVKVSGKESSGKANQGVLIKDLAPGRYTIEAQVEGYSTGSLNTKIIPGKTVEETLLLGISFGSLKVFAADARYPKIPFDKDISIKLGDKEAFGKGSDGVIISGLYPGRYTFEVSAAGFKPEKQTVNTAAGETKEVKVLLNPLLGGIKIIAVNAKNPSRLIRKNLEVTVRGKKSYGRANEGVIINNLESGKYTVNGSVDGFFPGTTQVEVVEGKTVQEKLFLSPLLEDNEIARIILTWGDYPRDLDAYLCPLGTNNWINWQKKAMTGGFSVVAKLDADARYGKGPETITIYKGAKGTYKFYVILYIFNGIHLGSSDARAEIITRHDRRTIRIPTGSDCETRGWDVANLRIDGTNVYIETTNKCYVPKLVEVNKD